LMMYCLETYYEHSHDQRVIDVMTKYFKYHLGLPDDQLLTHYWQKMRGGDELYSIYWLYNRTGDPFLMQLADKIHRCTANWEMDGTLPNWHNVNIAESFREPAEHFEETHDPAELQDSYADFMEVRKRYGQVPGGMFGGDENCRPGYSDPRQAIETCGMVEQMLSDELLVQLSGDPFWADNCENVAFNTYPAALTPDMRALRYLTAPNLVVSDAKNHSPGIQNGGPFLLLNPFSSRCCQHNHSMGWPYFTKHLWLASPDNGLCAVVFSASSVIAQVGDGTKLRIEEQTHYPFEEKIRFTLHPERAVTFPLYLRIPGWSHSATVTVNGEQVSIAPQADNYVRIEREWNDNDEVTLDLPMKLSVQRWTENHDSVSVNYGPLTFSLKIGERVERVDSIATAIGDSAWQPTADPGAWPSFGYYPTTPWNYGLVLDDTQPEKSFAIHGRAWPKDDYPFTPESVPIELTVAARQIPEWTLDQYGLCAVLQQSPVRSDQAEEQVTLIPMGATRLRVSAFPTIGSGPDAHDWIAPAIPRKSVYRASASFVSGSDTVDALDDGLVPKSSNDQSIPRFTWWDHRGSTEWVQYDFPQPKDVSKVEVYWFDDTGTGECRIPKSWQLQYQDNGEWKPVPGATTANATRDEFNLVSFPTLNTSSLRIQVQLQSGFSGGILAWRLK
ncbi:MAG: beta-L-arabinofuranosidase domain-containing protein, partial [Verrucomicrobiota bacterium]